MKIASQAPNRIDLAGGTLDIYPLYVFLEGGYTLNAAIDLYSRVEIETRDDDQFSFRSVDMGAELEISRADLLSGAADDSLFRLLIEIVRFYLPTTGLHVTTHNQAPKGSGLGASSALLIALSGALNQLHSRYADGETLIRHGADLEAWSLGIPTGKQDYYAAMYGGLQAIHFGKAGIQREHLKLSPDFVKALNAGLVLSFTGQSHFSGTNNWNMMKRYIDDSGDSRTALRQIGKTSASLRQALLAEDLERVYRLINEEWHNRKSLAEGVTTDQIESMIAAADAAGAKASKICGAGGGGCLLTLCPPDEREAVQQALSETGAEIMPQQIVFQGLQVTGVEA